ncbi:MAG: type II secretion system F family protein [Geminicoccaceae bacterium]
MPRDDRVVAAAVPTFAYQAMTAAGERVAGRLDAADQRSAIRQLQQRGLLPIDASQLAAAASVAKRAPTLRAGKQVTQLTQELATLVGAGQPIETALRLALDELPHKGLAEALGRITERVRSGAALSDALAEEKTFFPPVYVNMVRVGEAAGRLDRALAELATMRERSETLQSKLISALIYPVILTIVAVGAVLILLGVVVPRMEPMFAAAGHALPVSTQIVLAAARVIQGYGLWLLAGVAILALAGSRLAADPTIGRALDATLFRIPGIGRLVRDRVTAQLCRSLATCLGGGLDLPQALGVSRDTVANRHARAAIDKVIGEVRTGRTLADSLAASAVLAPIAVKMLKAGEESGQLQPIAAHLAQTFEDRVVTRLQRFVAIIEPVMVIVLGLVVGGIVMSILTAVLTVNDLAL